MTITTSDCARQLDGGVLSLLGRLAHGVDEADVRASGNRFRMSATRCRTFSIDCVVCAATPMRGCSSSAGTSSSSSTTSKSIEVAGQPAHLHVIALPDDHHVVAVADERRHRAMGHVDERTGGLDDVEAERASAASARCRRAVRRDHQGLGRHLPTSSSRSRCPWRAARRGRVGLWTRSPRMVSGRASALGERQRDRVAHAEAHAQMRRAKSLHWRAPVIYVSVTFTM